MLASVHFEENENHYRFKLGDYMDEISSKASDKIVPFIQDVYDFEQASVDNAVLQKAVLQKESKRETRKAKALKNNIQTVDVNVADVTLTSQSSASSSAFSELRNEVKNLNAELEKLKKDKKNVESNRDVSQKRLIF